MNNIHIGRVEIGENTPLTLIGGPCAIESAEHSFEMCDKIKKITDKLKIQYIFKSCFNKDCRSSIKSFHGIGIETGLNILNEVKKTYNVPVTTDVSNVAWMKDAAEVADMIQIPAYLSRQTHLIVAAGETGKAVNIKKGQFLSPEQMHNAAMKVKSTGNENILLTDRGTFFGYNNLVNDMRCFYIMKQSGYPTCYDATHSIQLPASLVTHSGGKRQYIQYLSRAAIGAGANSIFLEIHDKPNMALCDSKSQLNIKYLEELLIQIKAVYNLVQKMDEIKYEQ